MANGMRVGALLAGILLLAAEGRPASAAVPFFENGTTSWAVVLSPRAGPEERYAAQELTNALFKIAGARFAIVTNSPGAGPAIVVGDLLNPEVASRAERLRLRAGAVEEAVVATLDGRLYLAGNQPRGALYAVYSFLQDQLGVRWLWPGPGGEFMPRRAGWSLPDLAYRRQPGFPYRGFHLCGDYYREPDAEVFREWMARNFINIYRHAASPREKRRGFYSMWSSHNVRLSRDLFAAHPEYFAEIGGRRYDSNICFSHPEVDRLVAEETALYLRRHPVLDILSVFPSDNMNYCRCAACAGMDVSTAWFSFYNRLTDALRKEFPDVAFATLAYQGFRDVPKCEIRNTAFVEYATYDRCNAHGFGRPGCAKNEETLRNLRAWKDTGIPIGNYAYEYDIFRRNGRFLPFLGMIDDGIKAGRELGLVTVFPEVILMSTNYAPESQISSFQNRLSLYVYARLLWDPGQPMTNVLADWCQTVFCEAAAPMDRYYRRMDAAWSALPVHPGILGDALTVAPLLLAGRLQEEAAADFDEAAKRVAGIADPERRGRASASLERERVLFDQWRQLARIHAHVPRVNLPLLATAGDLAGSASRALAVDAGTEVQLAWTREALLARWKCRGPAAGSEGDPGGEDAVALELASGLTGETWRFTAGRRGLRRAVRELSTGVIEETWKPSWQAAAKPGPGGWEAEMTLPFAALGQAARSNESWQARFSRMRPGAEPVVFPAGDPAMVFFCTADRTDRTLLWWSGCPGRENVETAGVRSDAGLLEEFARNGWNCQVVTNRERLLALSGRSEAYWFRHPNGPNKVPADYWAGHLAPAVSNGAVAFFVSYWNIPLDRYFNDPALKVTVSSPGLPLAGRVSAFVAPGDWSRKPHDLLPRLKTRITPAYGFVPATPEAWTVLASAPAARGEPVPYLLTARYGKGLIVLGGDAIAIPPALLLGNLLLHHSRTGSPP